MIKQARWFYGWLVVVMAAGWVNAAVNPRLMQELRYVELLTEMRFLDYAEMVLVEVERNFTDAESQAIIKVRKLGQLLAQGRFDEVKAIIAREPDQDASTTWAMKLSMADYYFAYGKYPEALAIYQAFFEKYDDKPPEEIASFFVESLYKYAQMLILLKKDDEALLAYKRLSVTATDDFVKRQAMFETGEIHLRLAKGLPEGSTERKEHLEQAKQSAYSVMWTPDLWYGRGIALLAHVRVLEGNIEGAQRIISEYMEQLRQIEKDLIEAGLEEGLDLSHLSPVAEARYLLGVILMDEAKRVLDDKELTEKEQTDRARDLIFGRENAQKVRVGGALRELANVFARYPGTTYAPDAALRVEEIEVLAVPRLARDIGINITPEQRAEIARQQFRAALIQFNQGQLEQAIEAYLSVLRLYPESVPDAIQGLENLVRAYVELWDPENPETDMHELHADMVVGYLAERFPENAIAMPDAGNALIRLAAFFGERGQEGKKQAINDLFFRQYPAHPQAPVIWLNTAQQAAVAQDWMSAAHAYRHLVTEYTNSVFRLDAMFRLAQIYRDHLGDAEEELATLKDYVEALEARARSQDQPLITGQFLLAQALRQQGLAGVRASDAEVAEAANASLRAAIARFTGIIGMLTGGNVAQYQSGDDEIQRNRDILELSYYGKASALASLTLPQDQVPALRQEAIAQYEALVMAFPKSERLAPAALMQIGTLWSILRDSVKADNAFTRLSQEFPDSTEAKMSVYARARALLDMGYRQEGLRILRQMFDAPDMYSAGQMLSVGQELLKSGETTEAMQAFEIALRKSQEPSIVMQATLGMADIMIAQGRFTDAVASLEKFIASYPRSALMINANLKLSHAASEAAVVEDDFNKRIGLFNKAMDAMRIVRQFRTTAIDIVSTDLAIGEILLRKARAERRLGNAEREARYNGEAIAYLMRMIDSADLQSLEIRQYIERAYAMMVPLMRDMKEHEDVRLYTQRYLVAFPNGPSVADMRSWLNEATIHLRTN